MSKPFDPVPHFIKLNNAIDKESYTDIISICDTILNGLPLDEDALQCKITALIKLSKFESAIKIIKTTPKYIFEHSYCLYRLRRFDEALKTLSTIPISSRDEGYYHLEAQINYLSGNYLQSRSIYELKFNNDLSEDAELACNYISTCIGSSEKPKSEVLNFNDPSYELIYNQSCIYLQLGLLNDAVSKVQVAQDLCERTLAKDGLSRDEIEQETSMMKVQYAYMLQLLGQSNEALTIYNDIVNKKYDDPAVMSTAFNNMMTLRTDGKFFDVLKHQNKALHQDAKLSLRQKKTLQLNHCLLLLQGKQGDKVREELQQLSADMPDSDSPVIAQASLFVREKKVDEAISLLSNFLVNHSASVPVRLTLAHLYLLQNNYKQVIELFSEFLNPQSTTFSNSFRPAVLAVIVDLYKKIGSNDLNNALSVLEQSLSYWQSRPASDSVTSKRVDGIVLSILLEIVKLQQALGKNKSATLAILEKFYKAKKDTSYLGKIVSCLAVADSAACATYEGQMPAIPNLNSINIASLEILPAPNATGPRAKDVKAVKIGKVKIMKPRKKRVRKSILPKAWDATKPNGGLPPADPERWLPKYQRSSYKVKGKKKNAIGKGSQGAVAKKIEEKVEEKEPVPAPSAPAGKSKKKK